MTFRIPCVPLHCCAGSWQHVHLARFLTHPQIVWRWPLQSPRYHCSLPTTSLDHLKHSHNFNYTPHKPAAPIPLLITKDVRKLIIFAQCSWDGLQTTYTYTALAVLFLTIVCHCVHHSVLFTERVLTSLTVPGVITATIVKVAQAAVSCESVHDPSRTDGMNKSCLPGCCKQKLA